jgi:hypothetical protein
LLMMFTWTEGLVDDATVTTQPTSIATSRPSRSTKKSRVSVGRSDLMLGTALLIVTPGFYRNPGLSERLHGAWHPSVSNRFRASRRLVLVTKPSGATSRTLRPPGRTGGLKSMGQPSLRTEQSHDLHSSSPHHSLIDVIRRRSSRGFAYSPGGRHRGSGKALDGSTRPRAAGTRPRTSACRRTASPTASSRSRRSSSRSRRRGWPCPDTRSS